MNSEPVPQPEPRGALVPPPRYPPTAVGVATPPPPREPRRWASEQAMRGPRPALWRLLRACLDALDRVGDGVARAFGAR